MSLGPEKHELFLSCEMPANRTLDVATLDGRKCAQRRCQRVCSLYGVETESAAELSHATAPRRGTHMIFGPSHNTDTVSFCGVIVGALMMMFVLAHGKPFWLESIRE